MRARPLYLRGAGRSARYRRAPTLSAHPLQDYWSCSLAPFIPSIIRSFTPMSYATQSTLLGEDLLFAGNSVFKHQPAALISIPMHRQLTSGSIYSCRARGLPTSSSTIGGASARHSMADGGRDLRGLPDDICPDGYASILMRRRGDDMPGLSLPAQHPSLR